MTIIRKTINKDRSCGQRYKSKKRYSLYKSEINVYWEKVNKSMVEQLCIDHNLDVNDFLHNEKRNMWEHTYDNIIDKGFRHCSKSIRDHMLEEKNEIVSPDEYCYA